jgi:hypothetical protein
MIGALQTFNLETFMDSHNAISSLEFAAGLFLSTLPGGHEIDLFGQQASPASLGVAPEKVKALQMTAISGRISSGSGGSVSLQVALANNLRTRLARAGLTLSPMTLKARDTPLHRLYCEAIFAGHRKSERESFGLLPTVTAREGRDWSKAQILASLDNGTGVAKRICNNSTEALTKNLISGLNPYFAAWMMGYPPAWLNSMRLGIQSFRKSRRNS